MANYVFHNEIVQIEFDREHGSILRCHHAGFDIDLVSETQLAENWRMMLKMPAGITHIYSTGQVLSSFKIEGHQAILEWQQVDTPDGILPILVRQYVQLDGDVITTQLEVRNDSEYSIEEIYPICIGGMANWSERDDWYLCWPGIIWGGEEFAFYREFPGSYIGPSRPTFAYTYPGTSVDYWQQNLSMSWTTLYNKETGQAIYFGNHNPEVAFSAFWGELSPCASHANPEGRWGAQAWPHPSQSDDDDVAIGAALGWVFFPFLGGHATYMSPPVVIRFHNGGWWESARTFRNWFNNNVAKMEIDESGMARWDAWQATFMATPEGRPRYRFDDLPQYAADAKDAGINLIMLAGWHTGGIDANYPHFSEPNPQLGTRDEFVAAIKECQEMGVAVMVWTNANQMNVETDWYKESLYKYAIQNPYGSPHMSLGYGFDSLLHLTGYTVPRMVAGNMSHPEFRQIIVDEWKKAQSLGTQAFLIDKIISGEPYHMDFNREAPGRIESSAHQSLLEAVSEFSDDLQMDGVPLALETAWDRMMPYCTALYNRYFGQDHIPVQEAVFPEVKATACLTGYFDFGLVNKCLRFGHIIAIEGINDSGSIADFPDLQPYVKEAIRLRRELADNIWWSSVIEQNIATVKHDGKVYVGAHESLRDNPASGSEHALVLQHFELGSKDVEISFRDPKWRTALLYRPYGEKEKSNLPLRTEIPQDQVLIVIPQTSD